MIGLNPSTADEYEDDPTVRRCLGYAERWHFGGLVMLNAFALRSTDPKALRQHSDPVGPQNDAALAQVCGGASLIVAAWGNGGLLRGRGEELIARIPAMRCFGLTSQGQPRHPLYLPANAGLQILARLRA